MDKMLALCHVYGCTCEMCGWHQTTSIDVKHIITVCDLNARVL